MTTMTTSTELARPRFTKGQPTEAWRFSLSVLMLVFLLAARPRGRA